MRRYLAAWLPVFVVFAVITVRGMSRFGDLPTMDDLPVMNGFPVMADGTPSVRMPAVLVPNSSLAGSSEESTERVERRRRIAPDEPPVAVRARTIEDSDASPARVQAESGPAIGSEAASVLPDTVSTLERERDRAVMLARDGHFEEAVPTLRRLHEKVPADRRTREDLVAVLHWAGYDRESLEVADGLETHRMERYSAEALARAARNTGRPAEAAAIYRTVLAEHPGRIESRIGLALSLAESGRIEEARERARRLVRDHPDVPDALLAAAHVRHAAGETLEAAVLLRRLLEIRPDHAEARRLEVLRLAEMGAPFLAARRAEADSAALTPADRAYVRAEQAAAAVRWIEVPPRDPNDPDARHAATDRALALLDDALEEFSNADVGFTRRRLRFDRILALRERHRMDEVVSEIEALEGEGAEIAPYVLRAGADAYLYRRNPERAETLYRRALEAWPGEGGNLEARLGLFHALVQQNDFDEAFRVVDSLVAELPEWIEPPAPREPRANPDRLDAEVAAALGRGFAGHLPEAQDRLEELASRAPMNATVRQELASVYLWRGWARRAERELDLTLAVAPDHVGSLVGKAAAHLELREFGDAETVLDSIEVLAPENEHLRRLRERHEAGTAWELAMDGRTARSTGGELGTRDRGVESILRTPPLAEGLRGFANSYYSDATFGPGDARHDRVGAGLELDLRPLSLRVALVRDRLGDPRLGASLDTEVRFDDRHALRLAFESRSRRMPLQAVLYDVDGWSVGAAVERRWSERRRAVLELDWLRMDDGNDRRGAYAAFEQRVLTTPDLRLTALGEVYGELNTREDAPYFNPGFSFAPGLGVVGEWTTWARYERSFVQRLTLTGGASWQDGFGSRPMAVARYEHDWTVSPRLGLRYGVRWARPIYDGLPERRIQLYGGFDWRIR